MDRPKTQTGVRDPVIAVKDLTFNWPKSSVPTLDIQELYVNQGEHLFVIGPSGSGKTTLLGILSGIVIPQKGSITLLGQNTSEISMGARDRFRADHIGYIFQMFNLIPYLTIVENVILPCQFSQLRKRNALKQSHDLESEALRLLAHLHLDDKQLLNRPVVELSVGQQQRVAAARALIGSPELLIADEPTSSLDSDHQQAFIRLLFDECSASETTLVFVSHDTSLGSLFQRTVKLHEINRAPAPWKTPDGGFA